MSDTSRIYLQPTPIRIWHWLNAFGIVTLGLTGIQIRFPEYINLFSGYKTAILLHNVAGVVVAASFALWFFYYSFVARNMLKVYVPNKDEVKSGLLRQAKFYLLTYFLGRPNPHHPTPENKFNPMQKSAYLAIMFLLMPLIGLSGILLINIEPMRDLVLMIGGLKILMAIHYILACCLCAFLFTHVYLATLGRTAFAYIKPMWTGWEEEESDDHQHLDHLAPRPN
jgi:thiosulfate reductase cytochrome b subunit